MQEMQEMQVQPLGQEDPLEKEIATHSNILAWEFLWTEEPFGLQSMRSQRVEHDWTHTDTQNLKGTLITCLFGSDPFLTHYTALNFLPPSTWHSCKLTHLVYVGKNKRVQCCFCSWFPSPPAAPEWAYSECSVSVYLPDGPPGGSIKKTLGESEYGKSLGEHLSFSAFLNLSLFLFPVFLFPVFQ